MTSVLALLALAAVLLALLLAAWTALSPPAGRRRLVPPLWLLICLTLCLFPLLALTASSHPARGTAGLLAVGVGAGILYLTARTRRGREPSQLPPWPSRAPKLIGVLLAAAVVLGAGGGIDKLAGDTAPGKATGSLTGLAVNAISGQVEDSPSVTAPAHGAYIDGGDILRVCDLSTEAHCTFDAPPRQAVVHDGDVLLFKVLLHDSGWRSVPYAKFFAAAGPRAGVKAPRIGVALEVAWPLADDLNSAERPKVLPVVLKPVRTSYAPSLRYIKGSTALLGVGNELVAHLPDGIFGPVGVALTEIGPPSSCFECNEQYVRFISFRARVLSLERAT